jgi:hypothetical protein
MYDNNPSKFEEFIYSVVSNVIATVIISILVFIGAPIGLIIFTWFQFIPIAATGYLAALGWLGSTVLLLYFYYIRRTDYKRKIVDVIQHMYTSERYMRRIPRSLRKKFSEQELQNSIEYLLESLLSLLVSRLSKSEKAASFLTLQDDNRFRIFVQYNHSTPNLAHEVKILNKEASLAGLTLESGKCLVIPNCLNKNDIVKRGLRWQTTQHEKDFPGRAMAPVVIDKGNGDILMIGVLCLDFKRPWYLEVEDQKVLVTYADKIAHLWQICKSP